MELDQDGISALHPLLRNVEPPRQARRVLKRARVQARVGDLRLRVGRGRRSPAGASSKANGRRARFAKHSPTGAMPLSIFWSTLPLKEMIVKRQFSTSELPRHWNRVALRLSAIPGLGQLYKGHLGEALFLMVFGLGVLMWLGTLLCLCYAVGAILQACGVSIDWLVFVFNPITFYAGFIPALLFWIWVAFDAFDEPDLRPQGANLGGANLSKTDLTGANLRGARLCEADLSDVDLSEARLPGADIV